MQRMRPARSRATGPAGPDAWMVYFRCRQFESTRYRFVQIYFCALDFHHPAVSQSGGLFGDDVAHASPQFALALLLFLLVFPQRTPKR